MVACSLCGGSTGVNLGGVDPGLWAENPKAQYDSWLTVGEENGANIRNMRSTDIDFTSWSLHEALTIPDGAVFWKRPGTILLDVNRRRNGVPYLLFRGRCCSG